MGNRFGYAITSLLRKSGYSDNATNEIMKWYKPKKTRARKNWRNRAWLIDFKKTKVTVVKPDSSIEEDDEIFISEY